MAHTNARVHTTILKIMNKIVQTYVAANTFGRGIQRTYLMVTILFTRWCSFYNITRKSNVAIVNIPTDTLVNHTSLVGLQSTANGSN